MTIDRVKPSDWGVGEKLTSAQANQLDENAASALDRRSGETDDLESIVTCVGAGRIIPSFVNGADADTTYLLSGGCSVIRITSSITATRVYTLSNTGASAGDEVMIYCESSFSTSFQITVKNGAGTTIGTVGNAGTLNGTWATFVHNGTVWVHVRGGRQARLQFTQFDANGTFTVPLGVTSVLLYGCGGGGGGGGGKTANGAVTDEWSTGGSGGGGAVQVKTMAVTTPGASVAVTIGGGGLGGAAGVSGSDGSDTSFGSTVFRGAGGGRAGGSHTTSGRVMYNRPGNPSRLVPSNWATTFFWPVATVSAAPGPNGPHCGGGGGSLDGFDGWASHEGYDGGTHGASGADAGSYRGGGGGGGGGGGPFNTGGNAGGGGAANGAGAGSNGISGTSASSGGGGGGGGGGAGGAGSTSGGSGGVGGNGGAGFLMVFYVA